VYSILWNVVIAFAVTRLWLIHAEFSVIVGLYLILTGLGRFVEEAYRGEPQTPIIGGLRLYQWIALSTVSSSSWGAGQFSRGSGRRRMSLIHAPKAMR
jgi:prolipoprotein diacylglyceryltransferase